MITINKTDTLTIQWRVTDSRLGKPENLDGAEMVMLLVSDKNIIPMGCTYSGGIVEANAARIPAGDYNASLIWYSDGMMCPMRVSEPAVTVEDETGTRDKYTLSISSKSTNMMENILRNRFGQRDIGQVPMFPDMKPEQIHELLRYVEYLMHGGGIYDVVSSRVYDTLKEQNLLDKRIYAISDDGETISAVYLTDKPIAVKSITTGQGFYGSSDILPNSANDLTTPTSLPVNGLTLASGYKIQWVAIPAGYSIKSWTGPLASDIQYEDGGTIAKEGIVYTVYHYTTFGIQESTTSVTIEKNS